MNEGSQLRDRVVARRVVTPDEDVDTLEDCGSFGFLRGTRDRSLMIDFRYLSGSHDSFSYATLERVSYEPTEGMTLFFLGVQVQLIGRNLATAQASGVSLLEAIQRHRVPWIRQVEELRGQFFSPTAVVVTQIEIQEGK